jgi:BirA family biotin operon repressor/biotin-[acetyl-CoA-carboxylase] ligase
MESARCTIGLMLDLNRLESALPIGAFGRPLHVLASTRSTNDVALTLAAESEPHGTLVLADEQTHGRGRRGTRWLTPAGSGLALSLILRPPSVSPGWPAALNALGALAVAEALDQIGGEARIKWPNDVLLDGRKTAGVLTEASWAGEELDYAVLGIGINITADSVPPLEAVDYPATSVELCLGRPIDRVDLLLAVLTRLDLWYTRVPGADWKAAVESRLAFRGSTVRVREGGEERTGTLEGLSPDGRLILRTADGEMLLESSAASLRPVADR